MIALGADHGGFDLKKEIKKYLDENEIKYKDYGTDTADRTDYPIYAEKVAKAIQNKECDSGILICRSGAGMTMAANKFRGVRAALGFNKEVAGASKADDDINVLVIPGDYMSLSEVIATIRIWIATEFKGGRYAERLQMIENIEKNEMK
ncbi:MAG: ribose 5-phosphate isomerase B [Clostridia bacterium]|nr:ribose 5-phosphate isomerase B [Clostridia bacterium]